MTSGDSIKTDFSSIDRSDAKGDPSLSLKKRAKVALGIRGTPEAARRVSTRLLDDAAFWADYFSLFLSHHLILTPSFHSVAAVMGVGCRALQLEVFSAG